MAELDLKLIVIAGFFVALVLARVLAGGRPFDRPARRRRSRPPT